MSGIMGIHYLSDRPVDREDLGMMVETLAHRGPDGADIWIDGAIGFGHRMLWTTPESLLEKLPLANSTGDLIITSDARIDNRDELISVLQLNNCASEKITDSQLILAAYEKWGEQCPKHLLGDFAFAIWDKQKQILFCARDHIGVKPFYYHFQTGRIFAFGSEIKALLCLQEIPRQLNEVKVGDYLAANLQDKSNTFYQDIFRLPPASSLTVNAKGIQIQSYWTLDPKRELRLNSDEEYAEALQKIFAEAVRCRLRSAFTVGSHLSGGLDSSSITCMARQLLIQEGKNRSLHTFSNIFDAVPESDERSFIEAVIAQGDMIPHYVHADEMGPLSNLEEIFRYQDEAISAPTHFLAWELNDAAQKVGVRVVLDGFDGDNTISHGEGYFAELANKGEWATFALELDAVYELTGASQMSILRQYGLTSLEQLARKWKLIAFVKQTNELLKHFSVSRWQIFLRHGLKPLLPQFMLKVWHFLRGHSFNTNLDKSMINRSFARRIGLQKRIELFKDFLSSFPCTERERHWRGLSSGVITQALEISDRYAAAFQVEVRHPFMDKRLLEFCLSLPPEQKFNKGWSRLVMRRAMKNVLPDQVQWRLGKGNMSHTFQYGLLTLDRKVLDEVMLNHLQAAETYVDTNVLRAAYERLISASKVNLQEERLPVWKGAMLALWLRYSKL
ncbi:lasso peptide isopeptide bond-forming cyclase [Hassallia byssoidea VB512170]|uniref:asparagine synthase (glutamine-hydrolyzing) n=1 Tax=Hassallia byssoidea VB512170 TaxID=1304833 RepID=A0A846HK63_9CYAN|nr:lasso peptide isopeptide bond-forming cyclase [Hassalia byssoidea]NEU76651.1 lasso peptide isopeptide bond-forming cyclase [Hassalia byssoidea VB512170]